jgi:hypothetical protein
MVQQRQKDQDATWVLSQDDIVTRLTALSEADFPQTRRYATELTSGSGHQRFDFALTLLINNLTRRTAPSAS